jgi:DNA-binding IclR family transcriptional regulator
LARVDALPLAGEAMPRLVELTGLTALLAVMGDRGPTVVRWERAPVPFVTALAVGSVLPLTRSASGRSLLAFTPKRLINRLISLDPGFGSSDSKVTFDRLKLVRKRGYDMTDSTVIPGLSAISAPILDRQNEAVASITLVGAYNEIHNGGAKVLSALLSATDGVSVACGATLTFNRH